MVGIRQPARRPAKKLARLSTLIVERRRLLLVLFDPFVGIDDRRCRRRVVLVRQVDDPVVLGFGWCLLASPLPARASGMFPTKCRPSLPLNGSREPRAHSRLTLGGVSRRYLLISLMRSFRLSCCERLNSTSYSLSDYFDRRKLGIEVPHDRNLDAKKRFLNRDCDLEEVGARRRGVADRDVGVPVEAVADAAHRAHDVLVGTEAPTSPTGRGARHRRRARRRRPGPNTCGSGSRVRATSATRP